MAVDWREIVIDIESNDPDVNSRFASISCYSDFLFLNYDHKITLNLHSFLYIEIYAKVSLPFASNLFLRFIEWYYLMLYKQEARVWKEMRD